MTSIPVDDHILLRTYESGDADMLFAVIDKSRQHLHPWLEWVDKTVKPEHSLQFIQQSKQEQAEQQSLALGIFYDGNIIGGIGMHKWDQPTRRAEVGYWICKDYEGKGIISTCLVKFIGFLFEKLGLNKVEIRFFPANQRSAKVAERLGFKIEGIIRQSQLLHGKPQDIVVSGLLKSEWEPEGK